MRDSISGPDAPLGCDPLHGNRCLDGVDRIFDVFPQLFGSEYHRHADWRLYCLHGTSDRLVWHQGDEINAD